MNGWIKLHRSIIDHWIWRDEKKLKWWIDILLNVNHEDAKVNIGFQLYDCKKGQTIRSLQSWAERWGVSKDSARHFLNLLEKDGMITHENITKSTRITICNYDKYQVIVHADNPKRTRKPNGSSLEGHANKNDKEGLIIEESFKFYKNEIEKLKIQPDQIYGKLYFDFCNRLCKKNPDGTWEYYYVLLIKNQVSIVEFIKLYKKSKEDMELIFSKINSLQTKKDYHNKYDDLYLTINNWLR